MRKHYPHVDFHSDYAAGMLLSPNQASIRKSLNSGRGWADLFIPYPVTRTSQNGEDITYHGLFIELKKEGTAIYVTRGPRKGMLVQNEQILIEASFLKRMNSLGYLARFAVGYDATVKLIDAYFGRPENGSLF